MKQLLAIVSAALLLVSCGGKTYTVKGDIEGFTGSVEVANVLSEEVLATTTTEDGTFTLTVESEVPMIGALILDGKPTTPLFLDGSVVEVNGTLPVLTLSGTEANESYSKMTAEAKAQIDSLTAGGNISLDKLMEVHQQEKARNARYYQENRSNLMGVFMLMSGSHKVEDPQELLDALDACTKAVQKSEAVQLLRKNTEARLRSEVGRDYTDIVLPNAEGQEISLEKVVAENKVVLLDFWASWCRPCMMELPHLTKAYANYHDKGFEIYGVSLDEEKDREKWIATVKDHKMEWPNVSELKGWKSASVSQYGVQAIPANFLIDSATGKIIAKGLRGEALEEKLAEILN